MREWKSWKGLHKELPKRGYQGEIKKIFVHRWGNSLSSLLQMALPNEWFREKGLIDLTRYEVGILPHFYEVH